MRTAMRSLDLTAEPYELRLKQTFRISGYEFRDWPAAVATVRRGGFVGRGEASGVYYLDDTAPKIVERLNALASSLPEGLTRAELRTRLPPGGARNALDCALWDLEAQEAGRPAWALAGLAAPHPLLTTLTLSADPPEAMRAGALALAAGGGTLRHATFGRPVAQAIGVLAKVGSFPSLRNSR